jgi:hypothetical protein
MSIKIYEPCYEYESGVGMEEITLQRANERIKTGKYWACVAYEDHLAALEAQQEELLRFAGWLSSYSDKDTLDHWIDWNERFNKNKLTNPQ